MKNNNTEKTYEFSMMPFNWVLCYISECSRKEECMRYQVCLKAPDKVTKNICVLPTVMRRDTCPYFHPIKIVRAAIGFRGIFHEVKERHHAAMRAEIAAYLGGGGTFYRYRNGNKPLMPEQQEWIRKLFRKYGYSEEVEFDDYEDLYRFDY